MLPQNTFVLLAGLKLYGVAFQAVKLVPFGEYVPFRRLLGWISATDQVPVDRVPGDEVTLISLPGLPPIGTPICYENSFPSIDRQMVLEGASFLVVVIALLMMRTTSVAVKKGRAFLKETQEGFSYIVARPLILGIMIMEAVSSVFGLDNAMLTIFASDIFRVGAQGFGFLQSARGVGAVIGSRRDTSRVTCFTWAKSPAGSSPQATRSA